jgi:hypothetical protein
MVSQMVANRKHASDVFYRREQSLLLVRQHVTVQIDPAGVDTDVDLVRLVQHMPDGSSNTVMQHRI